MANSLFKDYKLDCEEVLEKSLKADLQYIKLSWIKNQNDSRELNCLLSKYYQVLKDIHKSLSSSNNHNSGSHGITEKVITEFCKSKGILDENYKKEFLSVNKVSTNYDPNNLDKSSKFLTRYEFIELMVRIAQSKYVQSGYTTLVSDAFQIFMIQDIMSNAKEFDNQEWRKKQYMTEEVDLVLKNYLVIFNALFNQFADIVGSNKNQKFMSLQAYTNIFTDTEFLNEAITSKDINKSFNLSVMTNIDEINSKKHMQLTFTEFLEAISRISEIANMQIPIFDGSEMIQNDENQIEATFNEERLLENLMKFKNEEATWKYKGNPLNHLAKVQFIQEETKQSMPLAKKIENITP